MREPPVQVSALVDKCEDCSFFKEGRCTERFGRNRKVKEPGQLPKWCPLPEADV